MGQGLGYALDRAGYPLVLLSRSLRRLTPPLPLDVEHWPDRLREASVVLIATPDDAIATVASRLAGDGVIGPEHAVFHVSGRHDKHAIGALASSGAALGSFHPLQAIADPVTAPERLAGAFAGVEGDTRAVTVGTQLAIDLGMTPVEIPPGAKIAYHAGATIVATYTVALMALATQVIERAGIAPEMAAQLYVPLLRGVGANLAIPNPVDALTGPIKRGDSETVLAHLGTLTTDEQSVYRMMGRIAVRLARDGGLGEAAVQALEQALADPQDKHD